MSEVALLFLGVIGGALLIILLFLMLNWPLRWIVKKALIHFVRGISTEPYTENLLEFAVSVGRIGPLFMQENTLRAQQGKAIQRPFGSNKRFPSFSGIMFNPAQLQTLPTPLSVPVDQQVVIGPATSRPLPIALPIMVSGMAFGEALSEQVKLALAQGATRAGTAINTGEGPFYPAERKAAKKLIYQYNRGDWGKEEQILAQADAVEIQFGQGAITGAGHALDASKIDQPLRAMMGLEPGEDAIIESRQAGIVAPADLRCLVVRLRRITKGAPVGAKLAAGHSLEQDLDFLLEAGVDFVVLDGAQAASKSGPPILLDDFGLPTLHALCRAVRHLEAWQVKGRVSLIVGGGFTTPGDMLKALALGADAIYIGTSALFAASHLQSLLALPWEPPTQMIWYDGLFHEHFRSEKGARHLASYLQACKEEIDLGIRALGKTRLADVTKQDLFALDAETAKAAGIPLSHETP